MEIAKSPIEIIHISRSTRQGHRLLTKDRATLSHSQRSGYLLRLSKELTQEIREFKTASLARNTLTGEIYLLLLKTNEGDMILTREKIKGLNGEYTAIRGKDFAVTLAELLGLGNDKPSHQLRISENLANSKDFYTIKITTL